MSGLRIYICGGHGSGKTTGAAEVSALLSGLGLNVKLQDPDLPSTTHGAIHDRILEKMSEDTRLIEIKTVPTGRVHFGGLRVGMKIVNRGDMYAGRVEYLAQDWAVVREDDGTVHLVDADDRLEPDEEAEDGEIARAR
jgi:nucleoside-triphosphatase THEP1